MTASESNRAPGAECSADGVELIHASEVANLVTEHLMDCCLLGDQQRARNYLRQLEVCCKELATLLP